MCEHKRQRSQCVECGGSQICDHKRRRSHCHICSDGRNFCKGTIHNDTYPPPCTGSKRDLCYLCSTGEWRHPKETKLVRYLMDERLELMEHAVRDKAIGGNSCSLSRPDLLFDDDAWPAAVVSECDENYHVDRDPGCEAARMANIAYALGKPVIFLRWNPDTARDDDDPERLTRASMNARLCKHAKDLDAAIADASEGRARAPFDVRFMYYPKAREQVIMEACETAARQMV